MELERSQRLDKIRKLNEMMNTPFLPTASMLSPQELHDLKTNRIGDISFLTKKIDRLEKENATMSAELKQWQEVGEILEVESDSDATPAIDEFVDTQEVVCPHCHAVVGDDADYDRQGVWPCPNCGNDFEHTCRRRVDGKLFHTTRKVREG